MEDKVLEAMQTAQKPLKSGEIAKILDVDTKEVSAAIKKLKAAGKIDSPKRCYYAPKA